MPRKTTIAATAAGPVAPARPVPDSNPLRAAAWMTGAVVAFTSMAVAGRELAGQHDTFEIMAYRSVFGLCIVLAIGGLAGTLGQITRRSLHVHAARNISHFTAQNLWFYAITVAPLAQVIALEFTSPLWVTLLAPLVLQEMLTRVRVLAAGLGFIGVLIVTQPFGGAPLGAGQAMAAAAAIGFAGSALFTRLLTRTETITCILFYLTVMQSVFGLVCAGIDGDMTLPTAQSLPWLALVGLAGLTAHFCLTKALSVAPAGVVMPMDFARLPIIGLVGMIFYLEPLSWGVIGGGILILAANWLNIRSETARRR